MSGHSKWSNIKRKKEKTDGYRAKVFTKIGRELMVAIKEGGSADPKNNSRLRDCILKARANNIPNDNINRILKKAAEDGQTANYEEVIYEGYGPGGIAILVKCLTDNRNRTAGDLRCYFSKCSGDLGTPGCTSFLFEEKGVILIENNQTFSEEKITEDILEAGAEDIMLNEDDNYEITSNPQQLDEIHLGLEKMGYKVISAERKMLPKDLINLDENSKADELVKLCKLIDLLEDDDDVQLVFTNCKNLF